MKPPAVICDVDGTLADVSGIRHFVVKNAERPWKDFESFHAESVNVPAHADVVREVQRFHEAGVAVLVVTARRARWRNHTAWFLALNNIPSDALFMRANHDGRPDYEVKQGILRRIKREWTPILAIDDNPAVIEVWRSAGIPVRVVPGWHD